MDTPSLSLIAPGIPSGISHMITVQTVIRGAMEVDERSLITFVTPLLGFDHLHRFLIYQTRPGPCSWLQAVEERQVSFCIYEPFKAGFDPAMAISAADVSDIGAQGVDDIDVYCVVVLKTDPDAHTINLRAPILVNRTARLAKQVILSDTRLPISCRLRDLVRAKA
jgi:flagellar assembly factor FliW